MTPKIFLHHIAYMTIEVLQIGKP